MWKRVKKIYSCLGIIPRSPLRLGASFFSSDHSTFRAKTSKDLSIPKYTWVLGENMETTTIKIHDDTKMGLDLFREYGNESYDEVIKKVIFIAKTCKTDPELSQETIGAIEKARERIKRGNFLTEAEARKRLGL